MKVGDLVWNRYHNILRFGTIQQQRLDESGWTFYKVKWHCDTTYETAITARERLTNMSHRLQEYRKDQITPFSEKVLSRVLQEHKNEF